MTKKVKRIRDWKEWFIPFVITIIAVSFTYLLASWAIDSGRIFAYALALVTFYYAGVYLKLTIIKFLND